MKWNDRIKRLAKDAASVLAGFVVVVGLFYVATIPSIAANRQAVDLSYQTSSTLTRSTCGKAQETFNGTAALGGEWLLRGGMSVGWCWRLVQGPLATDKIVGTPTVNTWAEGRFGWVYDGISSKVKNHGVHCENGHCWQYRYYRYYFKFTRDTKLFKQTCIPWVMITIRGTGTYLHATGGSSVC